MKPIHFELASYFIYITALLLFVTRYRAHRDYLYAMIGCTLIFPFEWVADNHLLFMDYD